MTFHFTDPDGRRLELEPDTTPDGDPAITVWARGTFALVPVRVPLDRVEELIAGLRDTARQAAGGAEPQQPTPAALTAAERTMLTYALEQAQERIWSEDGFTDEDQAAVDSLRRLAAAP